MDVATYYVVGRFRIQIESKDSDDNIALQRFVRHGSRVFERFIKTFKLGLFVVDVSDYNSQPCVGVWRVDSIQSLQKHNQQV